MLTMVQPHEASLARQCLESDALQGAALQGRQRAQAAHDASPGRTQLRLHACEGTCHEMNDCLAGDTSTLWAPYILVRERLSAEVVFMPLWSLREKHYAGVRRRMQANGYLQASAGAMWQ